MLAMAHLLSLALCGLPSQGSTAAPQPPPAASQAQARIERDIRALAGFGTRHTMSGSDDPARGIGASRDWLAAQFESISKEYCGGRLRVELVSFQLGSSERMPAGGTLVNVLATLPGREPDRLVVVSGHYDSRAKDPMDAHSDAPGANDDASGVAVVLECARALGGKTPRASIVFMALAGEEQQLLGSTAQAQAFADAGLVVEAFITNDIVGGARGSNGRLEPHRVRLFSEGQASGGKRVLTSESDAPSRQLARFLEEVGERELPGFDVDLIFRQDRFLRGGDHKPFNKLGVAAVRFTEPNENYDFQHENVRTVDGKPFGDLPEFVDYEFVARVARINAAGVAALAEGPRPVENARLDTRKLSSDTRITWDKRPKEEVASYRVRMRKTDESRWRAPLDVGYVEEIVLQGYSKDDWLFALEACDPRGLVSYPRYAE